MSCPAVLACLLASQLPPPAAATLTCEAACGERGASCYGNTCLLHLPDYQVFSVPEEHWGGAMEVRAAFRVTSVSGVRLEEGTLQVAMDLQLGWRDAALTVCTCQGNTERREHRMPRELEELIWQPYLTLLDHVEFEDDSSEAQGPILVQHEDFTEVTVVIKVVATISCIFELATFPFYSDSCLVRVGSPHAPVTRLLLTSKVIWNDLDLDQLNTGFTIGVRELQEGERVFEADSSFTSGEHSAAGFAVTVSLPPSDVNWEYVVIYTGLVVMASVALNINIDRVDRLGPIALLLIGGLSVLMDAYKSQPSPPTGFSYLHIYLVLSSLVILLPISLVATPWRRAWWAPILLHAAITAAYLAIGAYAV